MAIPNAHNNVAIMFGLVYSISFSSSLLLSSVLLTLQDLNNWGMHAKYVLKKLASLNSQDLSMLRNAFAENKHPRFMKEFSFHDPYGKSKFYKEAMENADLEKLAKLIHVTALLLQTKVYLFWCSTINQWKI